MPLKKGKGKKDKAEGGRIGFGEGDTPSEAYLRKIYYTIAEGDQLGTTTFDQWKRSSSAEYWRDKWRSGNRAQGGRIGYDNGGPVTQEDYDAYVAQKESEGEEPMDFETYKIFKIEFPGLAQGGRIGFKDGMGIAALPRIRRVKPGYDQEFTLQRGVSAAPIKQSKVTGTQKSIIEGAVIGGAAVGGWELGKKTSEKKPITPLKKPITKKGWGKAYKRGR